MNFYQSELWRHINQYIYKKPIFEISFLGKKYFGVVREKKVSFLSFRWYQSLGLTLGKGWQKKTFNLLSEFEKIKRDIKVGPSDIMFQFGFVDPIIDFELKKLDNTGFATDIAKKRVENEKKLLDNFGLIPSFRENMPLATVTLDLMKSDDEILSAISKSTREKLNKAKNNQLKFIIGKGDDWQDFYNIWMNTAEGKGFNIIGKTTFGDLKDYLIDAKCGKLFVVKKDGKIAGGAICLFIENQIVYLYGATDRQFGNIGINQYLQYQIISWAKNNGFVLYDLLGVAPTGSIGHHLEGVSRFKQSFGGTQIEYLGNYDMILNKTLYESFKFLKQLKK